jgi:hypothetical protein
MLADERDESAGSNATAVEAAAGLGQRVQDVGPRLGDRQDEAAAGRQLLEQGRGRRRGGGVDRNGVERGVLGRAQGSVADARPPPGPGSRTARC